MNKIPIYQHPFVDVFKAFKLLEWKNSEKSGDVSEIIDKAIGKKSLQLVGPSNTATFVQLPKSKSSLKSLGLIGKFVYIEALSNSTRPFSIHLDYIIDDKQVTRISLSNIFKVAKVANTTNLQVPLQFPENWSVLCIHVVDLLEQHRIFLPGSKQEISMRSMQLCGNITIKGIYTSDIQYSIRTLPKEMAFKQPKDVDWYSLYSWIDVPYTDSAEKKEKENDIKLVNNKKVTQKTKAIRKSEKPAIEEDKDYSNSAASEKIEEAPIQSISQTVPEEVEQKEEFIEEIKRGESGDFKLKPDSILHLRKLLGMTHRICPIIEFNRSSKHLDDVAFACGNVLVHMNNESAQQRFSYSTSIQSPSICNLKTSKSFFLTIDSKDLISIWDCNSDNAPILTFTSPLSKITAMAISEDEKALVMSGKDQYKRDMLVVHNLSNIFTTRQIEIEAKQLSDFDVTAMQWNPEQPQAFISCGFENIRFWKVKSGTISGKIAIFQAPLKGKKFIGIGLVKNEKNEYSHAITATSCGMLFKLKVSNRTVEQVVKGNESFSSFSVFSDAALWLTTTDNVLRIWDSSKKVQLLEHSVEGQILCTSVNASNDKVALLDSSGNIGVLKLKLKTYETLIRSHSDSIIDFALSEPCNSLITGAKDGTIRVWSLTELQQVSEFAVPQDQFTAIACSPTEPFCACSFASGFLRVFDLVKFEHYESPGTSARLSDSLCGVCYSNDGLTLAVSDDRGKILLLDAKERRYEVFKTLQIENANPNYLAMEFSAGSDLFAHIGNNANMVCLWETSNYTLKYQLDLTGDIVSKIHFAANGKDLLILTATSKLKYFRLDPNNKNCYQIMEVPGLHDLECTSFCISSNCAFVMTGGKDLNIKVFDYAMRGDPFPAFQAFAGHQSFPSKLALTPNRNTQLISISRESNAIHIWDSQANSLLVNIPTDITRKNATMVQEKNVEAETLIPERTIPKPYPASIPKLWGNSENKLWNLPEMNLNAKNQQEYRYEVPEVSQTELPLESKNLKISYVIGYNGTGSENIAWENTKWIAYTSTNKLLIEQLENVTPDSKKQLSVSFGADKVDSLAVSPNKMHLAAYTKQSMYAGSTSVYILETQSWTSISHITIPHPMILSASFSSNNNVLMVLSGTESESVLHFYDYKTPELLFHSALPGTSITAQWNAFSDTGLEFTVLDSKKYDFWLLTPELSLQYQPGKLFAENAALTAMGFSVPIIALMGTILVIGKANGLIDLIDTRTNSPIGSAQLAQSSIKLIQWKEQRLIFATSSENSVYSVAINSQDKNMTIPKIVEAMNKSESILLDGVPIAFYFDDKGNEGMIGTSSGTIWLIDWTEHLSIRVCSGHLSNSEGKILKWKSYLTSAEGPPRRLLVSSTSDESIKIWNAETYDQLLKIAIPKEECLALAFHPFKQMCVCSFSDGFVRFFDLFNGKNMGRCTVNENDLVVDLTFFPNGTHILAASKAGMLDLIAIEKYEPLSIKITTILNARISIASAKISNIEPYNRLLICTNGGKMTLMNRRKFSSLNYEAFTMDESPKYTLMDAFNLYEYEANGFQEKSNAEKNITAYYGGQKRNAEPKEVLGDFSYTENDIVICTQTRSLNLYIRNYALHQVMRRVVMPSPVLTLDVCMSKQRVVVSMENGKIRAQDFEGKDAVEYQTDSYNSFQGAIFCSHNLIASIAGPELAIYSICN